MPIQEIPLTADNQSFYIRLGDTQYQMTLLWRDNAGWILDIGNASGNALILGIPLVVNVDLLAQYPAAGISGQLMVMLDDESVQIPTATDLGSGSHLYFVSSQPQ